MSIGPDTTKRIEDTPTLCLVQLLEEALRTCEVGVWVDRGADEHLWDHEDQRRAKEALAELTRRLK